MALPFYNWSKTAASNATADSTVNWAEGQAPSSVNDSARAMMASTAAYRDDIAGAIVTGGTSTAYTLTSYEVFDTLAHMANQMIAFTPHTTNGATVTLNVDGLGAKPLRSAPSVDLLAGVLIAGTPYVATYNNSSAVWYLQNFYGNPYNVPLAAGMDYWGGSTPNSAFAFPAGQAISRTTYASLFSLLGTFYGAGDGSSTFNLPDKSGRVSAMAEAVATRLTSAVSGVDGATLGATGGLQSHTLTTAQLAVTTPAGTISAITPAGTISQITPAGSVSVTVTTPNVLSGGTSDNYASVAGAGTWNTPTRGSLAATGSFTGTPVTPTFTGTPSAAPTFTGTSFGSGTAHNNVQPTIVCNYIIRVL
jgi:microcystin-dependent protein